MGLKFPGWVPGAAFLVVGAILCFSGSSNGQARSGAAGSQTDPGESAPVVGEYQARGFLGDDACKDCHPSEFEGYMKTRHHLDSSRPSAETIHGHFDSGHNMMASLDPEVSFRMNAKDGSFSETSLVGRPGHKKTRTEKMDIVIGSGAKGQSGSTGSASSTTTSGPTVTKVERAPLVRLGCHGLRVMPDTGLSAVSL